jgi:hypothetical protein
MRLLSCHARRLVLSALLVPLFAAACSGDDDPTGPGSTIDGIQYAAQVELVENVVFPNKPPAFFNVTATLRNTRAVALSRSYPLACPVLIRLQRRADGAVLYDETQRACSATPAAVLDIPTNGTGTLQSGLRMIASFRGDSVPDGEYDVFAAVMTEGAQPVILPAGRITF